MRPSRLPQSAICVVLAGLLAGWPGSICAESPQQGGVDGGRVAMTRLPPVVQRPPVRRRLAVGLPAAQVDGDGQMIVEPNVEPIGPAASESGLSVSQSLSQAADVVMPENQMPLLHQLWHRLAPGQSYVLDESQFTGWPPSAAPVAVHQPHEELPGGMAGGMNGPLIEELPAEGFFVDGTETTGEFGPSFPYAEGHHCDHWFCPRCGPLSGMLGMGPPIEDAGIGQERVIWAISEIEASQPLNNFRIRVDSAYRLERPDRAEYFWSKPGLPKGPPLPESLVDYQDIRFLLEVGGAKFSTLTELPLRIVDPERNNNSAGLGDVNLGTKLVMLDGERWQITQVTRTYFNTSVSRRGLGAGHFSLEPGLLFRFKVNDRTYLHQEIKFWFPLDGDLDHAGEILRLGIGVSHVWYETDTFAVMPTLELIGWTVLDGLETPPIGPPVEVDPEGIFNIHPGLRLVADTGGDLGLFELGVSGSFSASSNRWYAGLLRVDLRWSY